MDLLKWTTIPEKYVLKRWTRDLRFSSSLMVPPASSRLDQRKGAVVMSLSGLMHRSFEVMNLCAENEITASMDEEGLQIIQNKCKQFRAKKKLGDDHEINEGSYQRREKQPVQNPETRAAKRQREGVSSAGNKGGRRRKAKEAKTKETSGVNQREEETTETQSGRRRKATAKGKRTTADVEQCEEETTETQSGKRRKATAKGKRTATDMEQREKETTETQSGRRRKATTKGKRTTADMEQREEETTET